MIMYTKIEPNGGDAVLAYLQVLCPHSHGETDIDHDKRTASIASEIRTKHLPNTC